MAGPKKGQASSLKKFARRKRRVENAEASEPRDDASTVVPESTVKELTHVSSGDGGSSAGHSALDSVDGADLSKLDGIAAYEAEDKDLAAILDVDHADLAGSLHHLPYRTTLRLGAKPTVHRWLGSGGSGSVFFERVMAAPLRYNDPGWISPEGIPYT